MQRFVIAINDRGSFLFAPPLCLCGCFNPGDTVVGERFLLERLPSPLLYQIPPGKNIELHVCVKGFHTFGIRMLKIDGTAPFFYCSVSVHLVFFCSSHTD